jgi:hypothetical protein
MAHLMSSQHCMIPSQVHKQRCVCNLVDEASSFVKSCCLLTHQLTERHIACPAPTSLHHRGIKAPTVKIKMGHEE